MKKVTIYLICLFLSTCSFAQVTFSPDKPQAGQTVTITYNAANGPLAKSPVLKASVMLYEGGTAMGNKATPVTLTQEGSLWKGSIDLKPTSVGLLVAFRDSSDKLIDNNNNKGFSVFVHGTDGKVVQKARVGLAYTLAIAGRNKAFATKTNYDYNISLFEDEFASYPESKLPNITRYAALLKASKKEGAIDKIKKEVEALFGSKTDLSIEELTTANTIYQQIGDETAAEKYAQQIRTKAPNGAFVEAETAQNIFDEKDSKKTIAMFGDFEKNFPKSKYMPSLASRVVEALVEIKDYEKLKNHATKTETMISNISEKATFFNSIAWSLAENGVELPLAEEFSRKSLDLLKNEPNSAYSVRSFKDTYGLIMDKLGKTEEAYTNFKEAIPAKVETSDAEVNERYILAAMKTGHTDEVASMGQAFIKANKSTSKIREAVKIVLSKTQTPEKAEEQIASLEKVVKEKSKNELMKKMMNEVAPDFTIKDLKGNTVSLNSLKGKVIILDFWATWCGPCKASFPGMQAALNKYKDNPNVVFLFVNTWEKGEKSVVTQKVKDFIDKNKYTFTVPMDFESKVVEAYKVEGIPTKFVIDGKGNIRFKAVGSSGQVDTIVEEISTMIGAISDK